MLVLCGDTHFRSEEPFLSAAKEFMAYCHEASWNRPENTFLHLGDFYHSSALNGELAAFGLTFWNGIQTDRKILLQGNHDFSKRLGSALTHLTEAGVKLIEEPMQVVIEGSKVLILPYFYPSAEGNMKDTYSAIETVPDLLVGHFADQFLFGEEIDLSYLKCPKVLGHVHIPSGNYIGVPVATSFTERDQKRRLMFWDGKTLTETAHRSFLEYATVDYETEEVEGLIAPHMIWDVLNAPSVRQGKEKFGPSSPFPYLRKVEIKKSTSAVEEVEQKEIASPTTLVEAFLKDKEFSLKVRERLIHYLTC